MIIDDVNKLIAGLQVLNPLIADSRVQQDALLATVNLLNERIPQLSALADDLNAKLDKMGALTKEAADDIENIKGQLAGGLTADEGAKIAARMDVTIAALRAVDDKVDSSPVAPPPAP